MTPSMACISSGCRVRSGRPRNNNRFAGLERNEGKARGSARLLSLGTPPRTSPWNLLLSVMGVWGLRPQRVEGGALALTRWADLWPSFFRSLLEVYRLPRQRCRVWRGCRPEPWECPANGGIMPRWLTARSGWHAAEIGGPIQSRAFHCRPRSEPEAGDQHLFGTSASAATCSFAD